MQVFHIHTHPTPQYLVVVAASLEEPKLLKRVARLEDLEAIRHTWLDYCLRLDSADWTALGDVFTEDAVLEMDGLAHLAKGLDGQC